MHSALFVDNKIRPLKPTDSVQKALEQMNIYELKDLPVVEGASLIALVNKANLETLDPLMLIVETLEAQKELATISSSINVIDAIQRMIETGSGVLPVVDEGEYVGLLTRNKLFEVLAHFGGVDRQGALIVLEMPFHDYSLVEISSIVESNSIRIINVFTNPVPGRDFVQVVIKVNVEEISSLLQTFDRYGYVVTDYFVSQPQLVDATERYQALMKYLDI